LIVAGSGSAASQSGTGVNITLTVYRVLKGDSTLSGRVIAVTWITKSGGGATSAKSASGLWFLQQSLSGWVLLPVVQGDVSFATTFFPAPDGPLLAAYAYDPSASVPDKIAAELGSAMESNGGTYNFQLYALHYGPLDQLSSQYAQLFYGRASKSPTAALQILGLSGLIRSGNSTALAAEAEGASSFAAYLTYAPWRLAA